MNRLFSCGTAEIRAVTEFLGPAFAPDRLFPGLPPELIDRHRHWLAPDHYSVERRRLVMGTHAWVIRTRHQVAIVDTCVGNHKHRPGTPGFDRLNGPWLERLAQAGVHPDEVDFVFCTHLHADHVGWNTQLVDGRWVPTFPRARVICSRTELAAAEQAAKVDGGGGDDRALWLDSVLPVLEAGLLQAVDDGFELDNGLRLEAAPGHTAGNAVVWLSSAGQRALFAGDVCHHPLQVVHPEISSVYCADPVPAAATRRRLLEACATTGARMMPAHWAGPLAGDIVAAPGGFAIAWP